LARRKSASRYLFSAEAKRQRIAVLGGLRPVLH
jgi:hypothetical protein